MVPRFCIAASLTKIAILIYIVVNIVIHVCKRLHAGDLNEHGNFIDEKLVMHHETHGHKKCMGVIFLTKMII